MKKQIATVLTAALLAFPVSTGVVMAETTTTPGTVITDSSSANQSSTTTATNTSSGTTDSGVATNETTATNTTGEANQTGVPNPVVDADGNTVEPGTLPDSPLYWFENLIEKIQVALTFDPAKKAKRIEEHACKKLAEAVKLAEKGDEANVEVAITRYNEKITEAQAYLEHVKNPESEESQKLQAALTKVNANNVLVLGGLLEKLPPQAAEKLALSIVGAMEKAVDKADKMERKNHNVDQDDQVKESITGTDSTTAPTTETTPSNAVTATDSAANGAVEADPISNEAATTLTKDEFKALSKEAKKALEEFRIALGLKKGPQGNAYGYYYRAHQAAPSPLTTQSVDQSKSVQEPKPVEPAKQVQPSKTQPVQKSEVKNTTSKQQRSKDHEDQDRDDDHGKKDKGNRDRD